MKKLIFVLFIALIGCKEDEVKPITGTWYLNVQQPIIQLTFTADKVGGEYVFEVVDFSESTFSNTSMTLQDGTLIATVHEENEPDNRFVISGTFKYDGNNIILKDVSREYYSGDFQESKSTYWGKVKATRVD